MTPPVHPHLNIEVKLVGFVEGDDGSISFDQEVNAFYATSNGLFSVPKAGGFPNTLASGPNANSYGEIAVDGTHVYVLRNVGEGMGEVSRVPKSGGSFTKVVSTVKHFTIDSQNIYFDELDTTYYSLFRAPKAGGAPAAIVKNYDYPPWDTGIVAHESFLYWLDQSAGKLSQVDKNVTNGTPTLVPLLSDIAIDLAVDADGIEHRQFRRNARIARLLDNKFRAATEIISPSSPFLPGS